MVEINKRIDIDWEEEHIDVTSDANFIWGIANKLRGVYMPDKYGDVIIPMTIIRRFECALSKTKNKVVETFKKNPNYPFKAMCKITGFQFFNTSEYTLKELLNEPDNIGGEEGNFKAYINGFSANVREILNGLEIDAQIKKMEDGGCLYNVIKDFSELDLSLDKIVCHLPHPHDHRIPLPQYYILPHWDQHIAHIGNHVTHERQHNAFYLSNSARQLDIKEQHHGNPPYWPPQKEPTEHEQGHMWHRFLVTNLHER